jgi:hypothetical protein
MVGVFTDQIDQVAQGLQPVRDVIDKDVVRFVVGRHKRLRAEGYYPVMRQEVAAAVLLL